MSEDNETLTAQSSIHTIVVTCNSSEEDARVSAAYGITKCTDTPIPELYKVPTLPRSECALSIHEHTGDKYVDGACISSDVTIDNSSTINEVDSSDESSEVCSIYRDVSNSTYVNMGFKSAQDLYSAQRHDSLTIVRSNSFNSN